MMFTRSSSISKLSVCLIAVANFFIISPAFGSYDLYEWSATFSFTVDGVSEAGSASGTAETLQEAEAALNSACSFCDILGPEESFFSWYTNRKITRFRPQPQDFPSGYSDWVPLGLTLSERIRQMEEAYPSSPECSPTKAQTISGWHNPSYGGWTPPLAQVIDIEATWNTYNAGDKKCVSSKVTPTWEAERRRTPVCPHGYNPVRVNSESICRASASGSITAPLEQCECTHDMIAGVCEEREVDWYEPSPVDQANAFIQLSMPNNQRRQCAVAYEADSCAAEAPIQNLDEVGNPVSCASGIKQQTEIDFESPLGPFNLRRTYQSEPLLEVEPETFTLEPKKDLPQNVQFLSLFSGRQTDAWKFNIPHIHSYGGDILIIENGLGRRDVFYKEEPLRADSGTMEVVDGELIYTSAVGTVYVFDVPSAIERTHYIKSARYRGAQRLDYRWLDDDRLEITDQFGRAVTLYYRHTQNVGAENELLVDRMVDSAGRVTEYRYNSNDMVTSVTYPDGGTKEYSYDDIGDYEINNLVEIKDEAGIAYANWGYDNHHRGTLSSHALGAEKVTVEYHEQTEENRGEFMSSSVSMHRTETDVLEVDYEFQRFNGELKPLSIIVNDCLDCTVGTTQFSYNGWGMLQEEISPTGKVTTYNYWSNGQLNWVREGSGTAEEITTYYTWHPEYRVPTRITRGTLDARYQYDAQGNLTRENIYGRVTNYTYNANGQVLTSDGPRTDVEDITSFTYSSDGALQTITNALGHVTQVLAHDAYGRPTRIQDANGLVTVLEYNLRGWLTHQSANGDVTQYVYSPVGLLKEIKQANGVNLYYTYDQARRLTAITDGLGNRISYSIDLYGNRTRTEIADADGVVRSHVDQAFNNLNQLVQSIGANAQQASWQYDADGNLNQSTDALGHVSETSFDALNRISTQIDPDRNESSYGYDSYDRLNKVVDASGRETNYSHNYFGEITRQTSPDTGTQIFTYDNAGNLLTVTDARGIERSYQYDALNRVISTSFADNAQNISYSYDDTANQNAGLGRLTSVIDQSGESRYAYDIKGQVIAETRVINGVTFTTQYGYDAAGLLTNVVYPSGRTIQYGRDLAGQITSVTEAGQGVIANNMSYLPFGPLSSMNYGNGLQSVKAYDHDYRLTSNTVSPVFDLQYQHTLRNNVSSIRDDLAGGVPSTFSYDALQRLSGADLNNQITTYTHDAIANRLGRSGDSNETYNYRSVNGRLSSISDDSVQSGSVPSPILYFQAATSSTTVSGSQYELHTDYVFHCPSSLIPRTIWGTDIYSYGSSVCSAAVHHGLFTLEQGGYVAVEVIGQTDDFLGTTANGVTSTSYAPNYDSFIVKAAEVGGSVLVPESRRSWFASASDLREQVSSEFVFVCPPDGALNRAIWGTSFYTHDSPVCVAAVHAGAIDATFGGDVIVTIAQDAGEYVGTTQNGVTSSAYGAYNGAYSVRKRGVSDNTLKFAYDAAGNTVAKGDLRLSYDALGRVKTATKPGMSASYTYDANHLRASKTVDGVTTLYIYDLDGNLIAESDAQGNIQREYVYSAGMRLAMYDNGQRYYIHGNHLDAPIAVTDQSGAIQWQASVAPYGETSIGIENVVMNFRFPGQYYDAETGLHYNWNRYYDPTTGRYITSDPIGLSDGPNTYAYVGANPVNRTDSTGLFVDSVTNSCIRNPALCAIIGGATLDGGINVAGQVYEKGWSCLDWGEAGGAAGRGALWGIGGYGVGLGIARYGGGLLAGLGRGFGGLADDVTGHGLEATRVTQKGINRIEKHLTQTPGIEAGPAEYKMIERLRAGNRTNTDLRFYQHEIIESRLINKTKRLRDDAVDAARDAHHRTLIKQDLYRRGYERELYHPDALDLFD